MTTLVLSKPGSVAAQGIPSFGQTGVIPFFPDLCAVLFLPFSIVFGGVYD
jgi:hypothetical protein